MSSHSDWLSLLGVRTLTRSPTQKPGLEMTRASHASCPQRYRNTSFEVYPISFSIPRNLITDLHEHSSKSRVLASIISGRYDTYLFPDQASYYKGYAISMFAATYKKGGWDCLRHYKILAAGCIPYMPDAAEIPNGTMFRWPRRMLLSILELKGLNHGGIHMTIEGSTNSSAELLKYGEFDFKLYHDNLRGLRNHMFKIPHNRGYGATFIVVLLNQSNQDIVCRSSHIRDPLSRLSSRDFVSWLALIVWRTCARFSQALMDVQQCL